MKKWLLQRIGFAGKSLLWSVVLYIACMMIFNWDEMAAGFNKYRNAMNVAHTSIPAQALPSATAVINTQPAQIGTQKHSVVTALVKTVIAEFGKLSSGLSKSY